MRNTENSMAGKFTKTLPKICFSAENYLVKGRCSVNI
jgi:hypothetical protein